MKKENTTPQLGITDDGRGAHTVGTVPAALPDQSTPELKMPPKPSDVPETPPMQTIIKPTANYQKQTVKSDTHSMIFAYVQGDENSLQNDILDWFVEENPEIIFYCNWALGITVYLLFIYR